MQFHLQRHLWIVNEIRSHNKHVPVRDLELVTTRGQFVYAPHVN